MPYTEHEYYRSQQRRDERAADIKRRGFTCKKRSHRGIVLDPAAVEDAFADGRDSSYYSPNGFGGYSAQYWGVLYSVEYVSR